jgi:hypothetical protein
LPNPALPDYPNSATLSQWVFDAKCELKKGPIANIYPYTNTVGFGMPHIGYPSYQVGIFNDMLKWREKDPKSLNSMQRFLLSDPGVLRDGEYYMAGATTDFELADEFTGVPGPNLRKYWTDLRKLEDEAYLAIVTGIGGKSLEAFEEFVKTWKSSGGDQVTAEVNAWWATKE